MAYLKTKQRDERRLESCKLLSSARNEHSQFGEDGIIEEIFRIAGPRTRWCVEFGAWDGVHLSNTCNLLRRHNWKGVLIEGDPERHAHIRQNHPDPEQVHSLCAMIGFTPGVDTIDDILAGTPIPSEFDLISIDV